MKNLIIGITMAASTLSTAPSIASSQFDEFGIDLNASYSGTRLIQTEQGNFEAFVRQAPDKMRVEMSMQGQSAVIITRTDLGKNYMLMPALKTYMTIDAEKVAEMGSSNLTFSERKYVGREPVNGVVCHKHEANFEDAEGNRGNGFYWVSEQGIVMKVDMTYTSKGEAGHRLVFETRELKVEPQANAHFEIPQGYSGFGLGSLLGSGGDTGKTRSARNGPSFAEQVASDVGSAAEHDTSERIVYEARNSLRKGLNKIFGN